MASRLKEYRYYLSSGVSTGISVKISLVELAPALGCSVSGDTPKRAVSEAPLAGLEQLAGTSSEVRNSPVSEIFLTAQVFSDGLPLHPMVISSKSPTKCSNSTIYWNEWISFPVRYRDLSRNSLLAITIWQGVLRDGVQCLRIWEGREADSSPNTTTPSEIDEEWVRQECFRLDKLREKYERKEIARNEWMDSVTDRRIARIRRGSEPPTRRDALGPFCSYREDALLWLEMPYFGDVVVYEEEPYSQRNLTSSYTADMGPRRMNYENNTTPSSTPSYDSHTLSGSYDLATAPGSSGSRELPSLVTVWDPDLNEDNPAERKYRRLARDILRGSIDPNLKPSRDEKARIELLLATPTDNLKNEDKDLLWKFRYTLTDNKKAVVKFLLSVDWKDELEVKQATDLLSQWCEIDIADALKLLGREKEFKHEIVRHFAVSTLATAKNEDLQDFLLQLVQALRYEKPGAPITSSRGGMSGDENGSTDGSTSELGPLARFLIARSSTNFQMANYFYWYLKVEAGDQTNDSEIFHTVKETIYDMLMAQRDFMGHILAIHNKAREEKGRKDQKEEKLRQFLKQFPWSKGSVISLPLDPTVHLSGVVPSSAKMFKSAMYPAVIQFQTNHHPPNLNQSIFGGSDSMMRESLPTRMISYLHREKEGPMYKFMVKNGDDLRQDQLIMQMFILMDRLLKKVNLDLKLTPYRILATGANDGLMEFVQDSYPVSYVVSHFESPQIVGFLRKHNPDPSAEFGIAPEALSTYVKSVAGYCVLTYLLGIGDRHLDNLMMKAEGHMFHIDFGFVFGADPKPYPPPFKLTKEMRALPEVYNYCCQAYNWLRKSADLILNLLSLMADSGIEELSANPATTLLKVEEKFRLDLTDEQAEQFFLGLINDSVSALFPLLVDWIHKVATKLK
ncbi:Phosphatidylinositol 3/4-kinase, conserved site [Phytophthora cactorum]|nr:Phosphatidylinositol 3/4-kinase, conserved site [Phytophthora cactorum]